MKSLPLASLFLALALSGCSNTPSNEQLESNPTKALSFVKKACEGDTDLDWKTRASLTAQANYLDNRWERLADAANFQSAWERQKEVLKEVSSLRDYGDQQVDFYYQVELNYAKFLAECSILELEEVKQK